MPNQLIGVSMAKKKKSAEDIIYEIKDLLDDLELKINPEEGYASDDEDDLDEDEFDLDDEDEEDFVLRGARWLMMRAEGDEIDEDDTDSESISSDDSEDSEECEYTRGEYTDEPNISIAEITQKMIARGISFKDLVALYVLPHHENTADRMEFNQTFLQKKEDVIHAIVMATP